MKCSRCQQEYSDWRSTCPECQIPLLSASQETISELKDAAADSRRSTLLSFLRVGIFAVVLIGLATVFVLNYVSGRRQQEPKRQPAARNAAPAVTPTASPAPAAPVASPSASPAASPEVRETPALAGKMPPGQARPLADKAGIERLLPSQLTTPRPTGDKASPQVGSAAVGAPEIVAENNTPATNSAPKAVTPEPARIAAPVEAESATEISLEPLDKTLSASTGLVTLNSYTRARIYIDGQYSGVTPRTVKLLAGEHTITMIADGCEEWSRKIRLNGRQQMGLMASMNRKEKTPDSQP